jgi:hypothetical protein
MRAPARLAGTLLAAVAVIVPPATRAGGVPALKCDPSNKENVCPPAGFFCPEAPADADKTPAGASFAGCAPCKCNGDCACGSGCQLCSCGQLCCSHSPGGPDHQCFQPCPPGQTSSGDGTDWDSCFTPLTKQWGAQWLLLTTFAAVGYAAGGAAWARRTGNPHWHPHHDQWKELESLVLDGIVFSQQAQRGGPRAAATEPLLRPAARERERGNSSSSSGGGSRSGRKTKGKERDGSPKPKKGKTESRGDGSSSGPRGEEAPEPSGGDAAAAQEPTTQAATSTASSGGGRWVHIPT